jgi:hypothetical protein
MPGSAERLAQVVVEHMTPARVSFLQLANWTCLLSPMAQRLCHALSLRGCEHLLRAVFNLNSQPGDGAQLTARLSYGNMRLFTELAHLCTDNDVCVCVCACVRGLDSRACHHQAKKGKVDSHASVHASRHGWMRRVVLLDTCVCYIAYCMLQVLEVTCDAGKESRTRGLHHPVNFGRGRRDRNDGHPRLDAQSRMW